MIPQRDYNDFTKYVNENQVATKESLLARTMRNERLNTEVAGSGTKTPKATAASSTYLTHDEVHTLMSRTDGDFFKS